MRLLIYLLAMMTGFSAADAARPVSANQTAVAQGVVVVASVASVERQVDAKSAEYIPARKCIGESQRVASLSVIIGSPVLRHDIIHQ